MHVADARRRDRARRVSLHQENTLAGLAGIECFVRALRVVQLEVVREDRVDVHAGHVLLQGFLLGSPVPGDQLAQSLPTAA